MLVSALERGLELVPALEQGLELELVPEWEPALALEQVPERELALEPVRRSR